MIVFLKQQMPLTRSIIVTAAMGQNATRIYIYIYEQQNPKKGNRVYVQLLEVSKEVRKLISTGGKTLQRKLI